jgi:2'-5' RNA ligase
MSSLIVTARLNHAAQTVFDDLRQRHFPPERNFLKAHVTLFHALPSSETSSIRAQLDVLCRQEIFMHGRASSVRSLGNGVAFAIECGQLTALRNTLAKHWEHHLGHQDSQAYRPHITIQNKVSRVSARNLFAELEQAFLPIEIEFEGLDLWTYLGGPWERIAFFAFSGSSQSDKDKASQRPT